MTAPSLILALAFLIAAAHPFVTYPLSLQGLFPRRRLPLGDWPRALRPSVAICLCAYNEAAVIVAKVESMLRMAAAYGPATIHVYTDGCSDETAALLEPYRDRIDLIVSEDRRGKTWGMNLLVDRSQSELVMFSDANVECADDALLRLVRPFADPACGCTTAKLAYTNSRASPTSLAGSLYWAIEEWVKSIESATIGLVGVDGASFVVRRHTYRPAAPHLIDDLYVTLNVLIAGLRVVRAPDVIVAERSAVRAGEEYRRKVRIACQAMNVHRVIWPQIRRQRAGIVYGYVSHRLIKWMIPFLLTGCVLSLWAAAGAAFGWLPAIGVGLGLAAAVVAGGLLDIPGIALAWTMLASLAGVGQGVLMSIFTRQTFTTWEPADSVRVGEESPVA